MKKNKLSALLSLLLTICLLSIAASFNQCGISNAADITLSEEFKTSQTSENGEITGGNSTAITDSKDVVLGNSSGSSSKTDPEPDSNIENGSEDGNAVGSSTNNTNSSTAGSDGGSSIENATSESTSEYGGQNSQGAQKFAIVISGASYNKQHYNWFLSSTTMAYKLLKSSGYKDENIFYLFEDENEPDVDYLSTLNNFKKAVEEIKSRSSAADTILMILIGHGGFDGTDSYYCLSGSNIPDIEMADMFRDIKRDKLIFVFSPCNSGGFIDDLSGENNLIITSTRKNEANRAAFIEPFLAAFDGTGDTDSDGKVSFAEAFSYASDSVRQQYADNGWGILTEHAQLDDNGDKISSEALAADGKDGKLAGQIFLK